MCQMPVEALTELTLYLPQTLGHLPSGQLTCLGEVVRQVPPTDGFHTPPQFDGSQPPQTEIVHRPLSRRYTEPWKTETGWPLDPQFETTVN